MKASKYSEAQIAFVSRQAEEEAAVGEVLPEGRHIGWDLLSLAQALYRLDAAGGKAAAPAR